MANQPLPEAPVTQKSDGRAVILVYHRIATPIDDRWQICVSPENFVAHLRHITRTCEPLRLSELVRLAASNDIPKRAVAVTFDDGYRDNLLTALPLLQDYRVPATFFISGFAAGRDGTFWWELLNRSLSALGV